MGQETQSTKRLGLTKGRGWQVRRSWLEPYEHCLENMNNVDLPECRWVKSHLNSPIPLRAVTVTHWTFVKAT